ncbi:MAG: thermonuclease family protein [Solirubrobacterales bacterium]
MSWKQATSWIVLFALLTVVGLGDLELLPHGKDPALTAGASVTARVRRVVDGDTVVVSLDRANAQRTLRYIGVDTPETVKPGEPPQCFGKAASNFNRRLVEGERVHLEVGREAFDRYGRLLAYVRLVDPPATFVNAELMARGYARTLAIPPNTKFATRFATLQRSARTRAFGLWRACRS